MGPFHQLHACVHLCRLDREAVHIQAICNMRSKSPPFQQEVTAGPQDVVQEGGRDCSQPGRNDLCQYHVKRTPPAKGVQSLSPRQPPPRGIIHRRGKQGGHQIHARLKAGPLAAPQTIELAGQQAERTGQAAQARALQNTVSPFKLCAAQGILE